MYLFILGARTRIFPGLFPGKIPFLAWRSCLSKTSKTFSCIKALKCIWGSVLWDLGWRDQESALIILVSNGSVR